MPRFTSPFDGAQLFYRDYVPGAPPTPFKANVETNDSKPVLVFLHGWPMSSLMFDQLLLPLCESHRFRCIAPDRRGFGNSDWSGVQPVDIGCDTFADDVIHLLESLKIKSFVFIAASMGCGESVLVRSRSRYVQEHCKGFIWLGPGMPFPIQTPNNPAAPSRELWDSILEGLRVSRPEFVHAALPGIFGVPVGVEVGEKTLQRYERIIDAADALAFERCVQIITARDFTAELRKLSNESDTPVMVLHGDADQGMPYEASTKIIKEIVPRTQVNMYEKAGHGLYLTHAPKVLQDILDFVTRSAATSKL